MIITIVFDLFFSFVYFQEDGTSYVMVMTPNVVNFVFFIHLLGALLGN